MNVQNAWGGGPASGAKRLNQQLANASQQAAHWQHPMPSAVLSPAGAAPGAASGAPVSWHLPSLLASLPVQLTSALPGIIQQAVHLTCNPSRSPAASNSSALHPPPHSIFHAAYPNAVSSDLSGSHGATQATLPCQPVPLNHLPMQEVLLSTERNGSATNSGPKYASNSHPGLDLSSQDAAAWAIDGQTGAAFLSPLQSPSHVDLHASSLPGAGSTTGTCHGRTGRDHASFLEQGSGSGSLVSSPLGQAEVARDPAAVTRALRTPEVAACVLQLLQPHLVVLSVSLPLHCVVTPETGQCHAAHPCRAQTPDVGNMP